MLVKWSCWTMFVFSAGQISYFHLYFIYFHIFGPKIPSSVSWISIFHGKSPFLLVNNKLFHGKSASFPFISYESISFSMVFPVISHESIIFSMLFPWISDDFSSHGDLPAPGDKDLRRAAEGFELRAFEVAPMCCPMSCSNLGWMYFFAHIYIYMYRHITL